MEPTLCDGDVVWVSLLGRSMPDVGTVVALRDPTRPSRVLVKRLSSRTDTCFAVRSDNPVEASDSRQFGSVPNGHCLGRATHRFRPSDFRVSVVPVQ